MLVSALALEGNWLVLALWGTFVGLIVPVIMHKIAPVRATRVVRATSHSAHSSGNTLRWVGAIVLAIGGFLMWRMLGEGDATALYDAGHRWLASTSVYLAGLPVGLGLNMLATNFSFMSADPGESS